MIKGMSFLNVWMAEHYNKSDKLRSPFSSLSCAYMRILHRIFYTRTGKLDGWKSERKRNLFTKSITPNRMNSAIIVIYCLLDALTVSIVNIWWLMTFVFSFFILHRAYECGSVFVICTYIYNSVNRKYVPYVNVSWLFIPFHIGLSNIEEPDDKTHSPTHVYTNAEKQPLTTEGNQTIRAIKLMANWTSE